MPETVAFTTEDTLANTDDATLVVVGVASVVRLMPAVNSEVDCVTKTPPEVVLFEKTVTVFVTVVVPLTGHRVVVVVATFVTTTSCVRLCGHATTGTTQLVRLKVLVTTTSLVARAIGQSGEALDEATLETELLLPRHVVVPALANTVVTDGALLKDSMPMDPAASAKAPAFESTSMKRASLHSGEVASPSVTSTMVSWAPALTSPPSGPMDAEIPAPALRTRARVMFTDCESKLTGSRLKST